MPSDAKKKTKTIKELILEKNELFNGKIKWVSYSARKRHICPGTKTVTKEQAAFKLASNIQHTWEIKLWHLRAAAAIGALI